MPDQKNTIQQYLQDLITVIERFPIEGLESILNVLIEAREKESSIFICGNGGSWATASHMVCDFSKNTRMSGRKRMKVIGLGDNIPSLTAYANDEGYDRVFAEPLISQMTSGDVLIAISGSGSSTNVLLAVEAANKIGGITIGITGFDGGRLKDLVNHCLIIPSESMEMIEDCHMVVDHLLTICLRE